MPNLRLLPDRANDGATAMAYDEALLECAVAPTLRLYVWQEATVSLGYFQDYQGIHAELSRLDAPRPPLVRRITGGGAIWHQHEVTYCLVGVLGEAGFPGQVQQLYPRLHGAVRERLAMHGARLALQPTSLGDRRYREEPRCFASPAADDLTAIGGGKVLGSAARQRGRRVLMHGSLKLASNPWDGPLVSGCGVDPATARRALVEGIGAALGLAIEEGPPSDRELAACDRIRAQRYGSEDWVVHRRGPRA